MCIYSYVPGKSGKNLHIFLQHSYKNNAIIIKTHLNILNNILIGSDRSLARTFFAECHLETVWNNEKTLKEDNVLCS